MFTAMGMASYFGALQALVRPEIVSHMLHPFENLLSSVCLTSDQRAAFIGFDI